VAELVVVAAGARADGPDEVLGPSGASAATAAAWNSKPITAARSTMSRSIGGSRSSRDARSEEMFGGTVTSS